MNSRLPVPEDIFRAEGHGCAVTLPGLKNGETAVAFEADTAVKRYLAQTWGIGGQPNDEEQTGMNAVLTPEESINPP